MENASITMNGDSATVHIIVDDDGPGIPEDMIEKAFQPFVRLEGSRSRETGGSGLGLAITRSIILNHGGEISLKNRPEGGLRAVISLPKPELA
jgi:signal transduction histidine kinase